MSFTVPESIKIPFTSEEIEEITRLLDEGGDPKQHTLGHLHFANQFEGMVGKDDGKIYEALICALYFLIKHPIDGWPEDEWKVAIEYLWIYQGLAVTGHQPWRMGLH